MDGKRMGRHRARATTPGDDDHSGGTPQPTSAFVRRLRDAVRGRLGDSVRQRPKAVLAGAAAVVCMLALGGVVSLIRGFAPTAEACATWCATGRSTQTRVDVASPSASKPAPVRKTPGATLAPATVHGQKRTRPRATAPPRPQWQPRPQWHQQRWPGRRHGPGPR